MLPRQNTSGWHKTKDKDVAKFVGQFVAVLVYVAVMVAMTSAIFDFMGMPRDVKLMLVGFIAGTSYAWAKRELGWD